MIETNEEWQLVDIYSDEGITGTKKDRRPELLRLISDCEKGKIDFILTKSISRFSRNTIDCLELGGRYMPPCPETDEITISNHYHWDIMYKYMVKGSFLYKLHQFFFINEYSSDAQTARDRFMKAILPFDSE